MKPYELDPEWQAAHDAYCTAEYPAMGASAAFLTRTEAAYTMHRIETAYDADPSAFSQYEREAWARTEAAKLPPLTESEMLAVTVLARQIDERMAP